MIYLITGKAGAGKTYYAKTLAQEFLEEGRRVKHIDGDKFRKLNNNLDFSNDGRIKNLIAASLLAKEYESKGYIVILSFICPQKDWRDIMRTYWNQSIVIYIPGGRLWKNTTYERPDITELEIKRGA